MAERPKLLVRRIAGGLGDQLCATVAVRAAQQRYGDQFRVYAATGRRSWRDLFADQGYCDGGYLDARLARDAGALRTGFDYVFDLDGPEARYEKRHGWADPKPRQEIWCEAVDYVPDDLCPRWVPADRERDWAGQWLAAHAGGPGCVAVQFACDPGLAWKNYPHRVQLVRRLAKCWPVLVLHKWHRDEPRHADWDAMKRIPDVVCCDSLSLRQVGAVLACVRAVVAPDSGLLHFAVAVSAPVVGLFGATDGAATCRPYRTAIVLQGRPAGTAVCAPKAPCYGVSARDFRCYGTPFQVGGECMASIDPDQVVAVVAATMEPEGERRDGESGTVGRPGNQ